MHKVIAKIWNVFASMKTGLVLLFLFAGFSLIGTFVPQDALSPDQAGEIGGIWRSLGFTHLYSSKLYLLISYLLSLNLLVCTLQRWPAAWVRFRQRPEYKDPGEIEAMTVHTFLPAAEDRL